MPSENICQQKVSVAPTPERFGALPTREMACIHDAFMVAQVYDGLPLNESVIMDVMNRCTVESKKYHVVYSHEELPVKFFGENAGEKRNWTICDSKAKRVVDVAWDSLSYGFPECVEIMGLLTPYEAEHDEVTFLSLSDFVKRYRAYRLSPRSFLTMEQLIRKRE